jgi:hypothetical protein
MAKPIYPPCAICRGPSEFDYDGDILCRYCFSAAEELTEESHNE